MSAHMSSRWRCEIWSVMLPARWFAGGGSTALRLEQLYRIRFTYPESWVVGLEGGWEQHLLLAEGRCEGWISGRFRGANFPYRRFSAPERVESGAPFVRRLPSMTPETRGRMESAS